VGTGRDQGFEGADRGEDGVPVIGGPLPYRLSPSRTADKGVEPLPPAAERRLFVEVTVEQGDEPALGAGCRRHVRDDGRCQAFVFDDLDRAARSGRDLAHSASSWAARAISPLSAQFGSKSGDRQAMET